jgi:hypothetical protein
MHNSTDYIHDLLEILAVHGLERIAKVLGTFLKLEDGHGNPERVRKAKKPVGSVLRNYLEAGLNESQEEVLSELQTSYENVPRIHENRLKSDAAHPEVQLMRQNAGLDPNEDEVRSTSVLRLLLGIFAVARSANTNASEVKTEAQDVAFRLRVALEKWRPKWEDALYAAAFGIGKLLPFWLDSFTSTQAYLMGPIFFEEKLTLIFSRTSGLVVPLERLGTDNFKKTFPSAREMGDVLLKNPERESYFARATLNDGLDCIRHYQWDKQCTATALCAGYNSLSSPSERQAYLDMAAALLANAFQKPYLQMSQTESFDWWKSRFTRNTGMTRQLLSNRGLKSKHIHHAFHVDVSMMRSVYSNAFTGAIVGVIENQPILIALAATLGLSGHELARYSPANVSKRYFKEIEDKKVEVLKREGEVLAGEQGLSYARGIVDDLMKYGTE